MPKADPARIALAEEHVRRGGEIVAEQRALIERIRLTGGTAIREGSLLRTFEQTLAIFEADLDRVRTG